ncbi:MAG: hypothetical protein H7Y02_13445 [Candidatus Obscuribacterales bacterium]|nr:hypothetical protein [Steroidobacteraceae bacterium]
MKRKWWLVLVGLALIGVLWIFASGTVDTTLLQTALGVKPAPAPAATKEKPICSQAIVPTGADCIPQHMANLPPDPGEAGKATIDGIDADKDGVRDDVQRFIHETWPNSERARKALYLIAQSKQTAVHYGGELSKDEAAKLMLDISKRTVCYSRVSLMDGDTLVMQSAMEAVLNQVTNTPERWARAADFSYQLAHNVYDLPDDSDIPALCGFDPAVLPN